ncbi:ROK family protein [Eubacteriales bacterium OttesenSCG-928-K08]|nr:ROK family protein [Eubacteriales bacterium OttesenSCG-928-K08]
MKTTGSLDLIREINTSLILDTLKTSPRISKHDVAKSTGLSIPTVTKIITGMMGVGVVHEAGIGDSEGGRRPMLYDINPDGAYVIGSEIGDDHITSIVVDFLGDIIAKKVTEIMPGDSNFTIFDKTIATISEAMRLSEKDKTRFIGMGIGVAGEIDSEAGVVKRATRLDWKDVPIKSIIENSFHIPTFVDENVRLLTFAENWFGAGKQYKDIICLRIGNDISAGFMLNGGLFTGSHGLVGPNVNHMVIDANGLLCECGSRGCVKTLLTAEAIVRTCKSRPEYRQSVLCEYEPLTVKLIAEKAKEGDILSCSIMDYVAENLAIVIKNLAMQFDPDLIIVGGGIALAGDVLFDPLRRHLDRMLYSLNPYVKISPSALGRDAFAIGAATLVLNEVFSYPSQFAI